MLGARKKFRGVQARARWSGFKGGEGGGRMGEVGAIAQEGDDLGTGAENLIHTLAELGVH
jgi:hypothetical protein